MGAEARQTSPPERRTEESSCPRISCRSFLQTWKCDWLTQLWPPARSVPLPSDSHVLDIGAQEQEVLVDLENRVVELNTL